jgi:hypothetical protein
LSSSPWTGAHSVCKHGVVLHRHGHARRCAHAPATAGELRHAAVLYSISVGRVCAASANFEDEVKKTCACILPTSVL